MKWDGRLQGILSCVMNSIACFWQGSKQGDGVLGEMCLSEGAYKKKIQEGIVPEKRDTAKIYRVISKAKIYGNT